MTTFDVPRPAATAPAAKVPDTIFPAAGAAAPTAEGFAGREVAALREAARDVVNVTFLSVLMKALRQTQGDDGLLHGGPGERVFRQQLDVVLIDRMSRSLSTPLADAIVRQVGHPVK